MKKRKPMKRVILVTLPVSATLTGLSVAGLFVAVGLFAGSPSALPERLLSLVIACAGFSLVIVGRRQLRRQRDEFVDMRNSLGEGEGLPEQSLQQLPRPSAVKTGNVRPLPLIQHETGPAEILSLSNSKRK